MPYVPGCSIDVFISYAHHDNRDGWVLRLKDDLTEKLNPFLGGQAAVWFDDRIGPGDDIRRDIEQPLQNTMVFVAVVSPSYLRSEFCMINELEWFQNHRGKDIVQLLKTPLEEGQDVPLPDVKYELLYDERDGHALTGEPREKILDRVVNGLTTKLRQFWEARPKIYVADVRNKDVKQPWENVKTALHQEGYAVLPKSILPSRVPDGHIRGLLEKARVSVHVAGVADDPLAYRQLAIAQQIGHPIITLRSAPAVNEVTELIAEVQRRVEANRRPAVYVIYDHYSDGAQGSQLTEFLADRTGCEVFPPQAGEKYHKYRLRVSDGVLLFRSSAPEDWFNSQKVSLLQAAALRASRDVAEAWYETRRPDGRPEGVRAVQGSRLEWRIERIGEPNVEDLQPFLDALQTRVRSASGPSM
jgi:hypothetical protein